MNDATRKLLKDEAIRSLKGYLATGLAGLLQKAVDRCRAIGVNPDGCLQSGRDGIEHLVNHLAAWC